MMKFGKGPSTQPLASSAVKAPMTKPQVAPSLNARDVFHWNFAMFSCPAYIPIRRVWQVSSSGRSGSDTSGEVVGEVRRQWPQRLA